MKKTSVVSIRIDNDEKSLLSLEGDLEGITVNALIGKIISKHIRWDRYSREIDSVCISKKTLSALLSNLDDCKINDICKISPMVSIKDAILFSKGTFTYENFLSIFDVWLDTSNIGYRHISEERFDKYIIKHELGSNFSKFLHALVEKILHELSLSLSNVELNENHISFEIRNMSDVK